MAQPLLRHSTVNHHMQRSLFKIQACRHSSASLRAQESIVSPRTMPGVPQPRQPAPCHPGMYHVSVGSCLGNDVRSSGCRCMCVDSCSWHCPPARCVRVGAPTSFGCSGRKAASGSDKPVLARASGAAPAARPLLPSAGF